jgi:hypothetical protein
LLTKTIDQIFSAEYYDVVANLQIKDNIVRFLCLSGIFLKSDISHSLYNSSQCRAILLAANWSIVGPIMKSITIIHFDDYSKTANEEGNMDLFLEYFNSVNNQLITDHNIVAQKIKYLSPIPLCCVLFAPINNLSTPRTIFPLTKKSFALPASKSNQILCFPDLKFSVKPFVDEPDEAYNNLLDQISDQFAEFIPFW